MRARRRLHRANCFLALCCLVSIVAMAAPVRAEELKPGESRELRMSLEDNFVVTGREGWKVDVSRVLMLRFGEVYITPQLGTDWSVALRFECDTPDLARLDTPEKMRVALDRWSQKSVPRAVEKTPTIERFEVQGRVGFRTTLTDAALAASGAVEPGQFRYRTQGIVRLSEDSALTFIIYANDLQGAGQREALGYIQSFVKPASGATTRP